MSCKDVEIPICDIAQAVGNLLDLSSFVSAENGIAKDLVLQGNVSLDPAAVQSLCTALSSCFDDGIRDMRVDSKGVLHITTPKGTKSVDLSGLIPAPQPPVKVTGLSFDRGTSSLVLTQSDGSTQRAPLGNLVTQNDLAGLLRGITAGAGLLGDGTANNPLRLALGDGLVIRDNKLTLADEGPCLSTTKTVGTYTANSGDEVLLATGGEITLPASIPIGKSITIIQTGTADVTLMPDASIKRNGSNVLNGQYSTVSVIKTSNTEWVAMGDLKE